MKLLGVLKRLVYSLLLCALSISAVAQTGLYVPSAKPVRNMQKALLNPEVFCLLLQYEAGESSYADEDLDMLDSAYRIAFDVNNPRLYTMTIESFGDSDSAVASKRAESICRYFSMRSHAQFPIRYANNPIHCSCSGDTVEVLRFEVPVSKSVYNCNQLPPDRLLFNKNISLRNTVLVTFRDNPDECVGEARGCYVPFQDSTVYGYYAWMVLSKGSIRTVLNTKDTCHGEMDIKIDDHLNHLELLDHYHLIPHRNQLLAMAGYVVIGGHWPVDADSCTMAQKDSIFLRIPVTQEQMDAKLRFYAKVRTARGMEYKALPTRKVPGKGQLALQASLNISMFDTIYIGKRLQEKELGKYFYEVDSPVEAASFKAAGKYYVASRPDKNGEPQMKKPLRALFRMVPIQQDEEGLPSKTVIPKGEEIIE